MMKPFTPMMIRFLFAIICFVLSAAPVGAVEKIYQRFADSEMARFPEAWQLDYAKRPGFGYPQGLGCMAIWRVGEVTGEERYFRYVLDFTDSMVLDDGTIRTYDYRNGRHNVDMVNCGKLLFKVYAHTGEDRYRKALDLLYNYMMRHPRNSEGGFWHKEIYPWQMWLDGLYMASPFLAEYAATFDMPALMDDVVHQFLLVRKHMFDPRSGLYYHAWDEKRVQRWCDPETGLSHMFWGRSIGWWYMALVDVLDFVPADHPERQTLIAMVQELADAVARYQEKGLWYQIIDMGSRKGNYLEASVSSMFMYAIAKGVNRGYLSPSHRRTSLKTYRGIKRRLLRQESDGSLTLTQCCAVAGLGGNPYRDGSFEYYISEPIRDNDAKATGPFIMGCLELNK